MKRGTPKHPKLYDLLAALELPVRQRPIAVGYLELLWHFTAEFAPQGNIGKYSDERIEAALDWTGKRGKLIEAFTKSGWCDKSSQYRLIVHDWHDHADDATKKKLHRLGLRFLSLRDEVSGHCPPSSPETADSVAPALPSQSQSQSQAKPPTGKPVVTISPPEWKSDPVFCQFKTEYEKSGAALIDEDFADAYQWAWKKLDWEQKKQRIDAVTNRAWGDPAYVCKPRKFIETEWKRPQGRARDSPAPNMYPDADEWKKGLDR